MIKIILIVGAIFFAFSFILVPWEPNETRTFAWEQRLPAPNDLAGWKLYQSKTSGGPYTLIQTIPFVATQTEYRATVSMRVSDHRVKTLYFVMTAYDHSGNESRYCNETSLTLDCETLFWGYDFIWARKRNMTVHTLRMILQAIGFGAGIVLAGFLTLRRKRFLKEPSTHETDGKRFYCETCKIEIPNENGAEVHRAFKHEVRESGNF
jgi:hypothetical protein